MKNFLKKHEFLINSIIGILWITAAYIKRDEWYSPIYLIVGYLLLYPLIRILVIKIYNWIMVK